MGPMKLSGTKPFTLLTSCLHSSSAKLGHERKREENTKCPKNSPGKLVKMPKMSYFAINLLGLVHFKKTCKISAFFSNRAHPNVVKYTVFDFFLDFVCLEFSWQFQ